MWLFGAALVWALLTMYMSVWYTAAIGIYALLRIVKRELPRRLVLDWVAIQVLAVSICAVAYATHLSKLRGGEAERFAREAWLRMSYFNESTDNIPAFVVESTSALFDYLFANSVAGMVTMLAAVAGIALVFLRRTGTPQNRRTPALSLVLPPAATCAASIFGLYPYGGSRHDAFLSVFLAAAVGLGLSFLTRGKILRLLLVAAVLIPFWQRVSSLSYLEQPREFHTLDQMHTALDYLTHLSPPLSVLVVEQSGAAIVDYYVCHGKLENVQSPSANLTSYKCGKQSVLRLELWGVGSDTLEGALARSRAAQPGLFPDPAWIFRVATPAAAVTIPDARRAEFGSIQLARIS